MVLLSSKSTWISPSGSIKSDKEFAKIVKKFIKKGCKAYVGTDSMLRGDSCNFATVIAFHNNDIRVANYHYKRFNVVNSKYIDLQSKITEEVSLAMQAAKFINDLCPNASIEIHVDIGKNHINKTKKLLPMVKGWVSGMGYDLRVKPDSWASSSIADNHTK
tara:strand:- start:325 stop:807 length:483 start_codon:yes stop_codon:yes gene_type:complete